MKDSLTHDMKTSTSGVRKLRQNLLKTNKGVITYVKMNGS